MPDQPVLTLTAADWYEIRDRGWTAVIRGIAGLDPRPLTGQQVTIDGKTYTVKGVETFLVNPVGKTFSLLIGDR